LLPEEAAEFAYHPCTHLPQLAVSRIQLFDRRLRVGTFLRQQPQFLHHAPGDLVLRLPEPVVNRAEFRRRLLLVNVRPRPFAGQQPPGRLLTISDFNPSRFIASAAAANARAISSPSASFGEATAQTPRSQPDVSMRSGLAAILHEWKFNDAFL